MSHSADAEHMEALQDVVFTEKLEEKCSKQHLDLVVALVELSKEPLGSILICSACTRRFVLQ